MFQLVRLLRFCSESLNNIKRAPFWNSPPIWLVLGSTASPRGSHCLRDCCNPTSGHDHPLPSLCPRRLFLYRRAVTREAQRIKVLWAQLIALRRSFVFLYKANPGGEKIFFALPVYQWWPKKLQRSHCAHYDQSHTFALQTVSVHEELPPYFSNEVTVL